MFLNFVLSVHFIVKLNMKNCFTVSDNITKSLMETTNFLWANCTKKRHGGLLWLANARIFLWPFFIKLVTICSRPFKFSSAMIVLFILLFFGLSFSLFFDFFLLLNLYWQWHLCHFCFLRSTFTWWYFSEKVCNVVFSVLVELRLVLHEWVVQGSKEQNGLAVNRFLNQYVVCDHNIDAVFSVFTRGEIVTFKPFCLTKGFFDLW